MNRRWFLAGLAAAVVVAGAASAEARMHTPYRGHRIVPANAGPLDGFTSPTVANSFRKLRSVYAGPAVKLRRVDTTTQDIGFIGNDFDIAAATAFCTTACTVQTWYDQSGNGRDLVQATAASQPVYIASCIGSKPCARFTDVTMVLASAGNLTPVTGILSTSLVASRPAGTGLCQFMRENGNNNRLTATAAATWQIAPSGFTFAATNGVRHAVQAVFNGASSVVNLDGSEITGSATGNITAGTTQVLGAATTTCDESELVIWDNYPLAAGERANLSANQLAYWGPP